MSETPNTTSLKDAPTSPEATADSRTTSYRWTTRLAVNACRLLIGAAFVFSGFVKAIDPLGTQYKIHDYLEALGLANAIPDWLTLMAAVALAAMEFALGTFAMLAIRRRVVARLLSCRFVVLHEQYSCVVACHECRRELVFALVVLLCQNVHGELHHLVASCGVYV